MPRLILLTEGHSEPHHGKTAASILRYRADEVAGVVDSTQVGRPAGELFGAGGSIPVRASLDDFEGDELVIGVAPRGGRFPEAWKRIVLRAIERGMNITSGLHDFLGDDPDIAAAAREKGVRVWDVRVPPTRIGVSRDVAKDAKPLRVHTVGLECAVGKMTVSIEIDNELRRRGVNSRFLATGQTGIMVSGYGYPIDRFVADFIAGGAETLIMENLDRDVHLIEGQGSIYNPFYSGVTMGLLHGCAPDLLVLCYIAGAKYISGTKRELPPLESAVADYERCANFVHPCKVVGIGVNTWGLDDGAARAEIVRAERATGLPANDVIRYGAANLVDAIQKAPRPSEAR